MKLVDRYNKFISEKEMAGVSLRVAGSRFDTIAETFVGAGNVSASIYAETILPVSNELNNAANNYADFVGLRGLYRLATELIGIRNN